MFVHEEIEVNTVTLLTTKPPPCRLLWDTMTKERKLMQPAAFTNTALSAVSTPPPSRNRFVLSVYWFHTNNEHRQQWTAALRGADIKVITTEYRESEHGCHTIERFHLLTLTTNTIIYFAINIFYHPVMQSCSCLALTGHDLSDW